MERSVLSRVVTGRLPYANIEPESIVLVGKAEKGPSGISVEGKSNWMVNKLFGEESSLANAYREFKSISDAKVYLIKSSGRSASLTLKDSEEEDAIRLFSIDHSSEANNLECMMHVLVRYNQPDRRILEVINPKLKQSFEIDITDRTTEGIVNEINKQAYLGQSPVCAESLSTNKSSEEIFKSNTRFRFTNGTSDNPKLEEILQSLATITIKQLALVDEDCLVKEVETGESIYEQLSEFAHDKVTLCMPCMITVGVPVDSEVVGLYDKLISFGGLDEKSEEKKIRISEYINCIVARVSVQDTEDAYLSNAVASYCGLISTLGIGESTSNKVLSNIKGSLIEFSDEQTKKLAAMGYVVLLYENNSVRNREFLRPIIRVGEITEYKNIDIMHGVKVYRGVNFLYKTNGWDYQEGTEEVERVYKSREMAYIGNALLVQDISFSLYEVLNPFIGEMNTVREDIVTEVGKTLAGYEKYIKTFDFSVTSKVNRLSRDFDIVIEIVPYGEVEGINIAVSIW